MFTTVVLRDLWLHRHDYTGTGTQANRVSVGAAFNKILGHDPRSHDTVVGYFNADRIMFAWSYMMDWTTDIGAVADLERLDITWRARVASDGPDATPNMQIVSLVRPMTAEDL